MARILVVDDNESFRAPIRKITVEQGHEVDRELGHRTVLTRPPSRSLIGLSTTLPDHFRDIKGRFWDIRPISGLMRLEKVRAEVG